MNTLFWIVRILLALVFTSIGVTKLFLPMDKLSVNMNWIHDFPSIFVRGLGAFELVVGFLVILPRVIATLPGYITVLSAYAIIVIMIGAIVTHLKRGEYSFIVMNLVLLGFALFIVYQAKKLS